MAFCFPTDTRHRSFSYCAHTSYRPLSGYAKQIPQRWAVCGGCLEHPPQKSLSTSRQDGAEGGVPEQSCAGCGVAGKLHLFLNASLCWDSEECLQVVRKEEGRAVGAEWESLSAEDPWEPLAAIVLDAFRELCGEGLGSLWWVQLPMDPWVGARAVSWCSGDC